MLFPNETLPQMKISRRSLPALCTTGKRHLKIYSLSIKSSREIKIPAYMKQSVPLRVNSTPRKQILRYSLLQINGQINYRSLHRPHFRFLSETTRNRYPRTFRWKTSRGKARAVLLKTDTRFQSFSQRQGMRRGEGGILRNCSMSFSGLIGQDRGRIHRHRLRIEGRRPR